MRRGSSLCSRCAAVGSLVVLLALSSSAVRAQNGQEQWKAPRREHREQLFSIRNGEGAEAAIPYARRALRDLERRFGRNSEPVAGWLRLELGQTLFQANARDEANAALRRAVRINERIHPDGSWQLAQGLRRVAGVWEQFGELERAAESYQRVLEVEEQAYGKQDARIMGTLGSLATIRRRQNDLDAAQRLRERALRIVQPSPDAPVSSSQDATSAITQLVALANIHHARLDYATAEQYAHRALEVARSVRSRPGDRQRAMPLLQVARVLRLVGQPDEARELVRDALVLVEGNLHFERSLPVLYQELASLSTETGRLDEAQAYIRRQRSLLAGQSGLRGIPFSVHRNLASLAIAREQWDEAERHLRECLQLAQSAGSAPFAEASILADLGGLYLRFGERSRAESLLRRAYELQEPLRARGHSEALPTLMGLAHTDVAAGRTRDAVAHFRDAFELSEQLLGRLRLVSGEQRIEALLARLERDQQKIWSFVAEHGDEPEVAELGLALALLRKGRSLDETASIGRALRSRVGPGARSLVDRLQGLRREYAGLALELDEAANADPERLAELRDEMSEVERKLVQRSTRFRAATAPPQPDIVTERVADALPDDGVLIEYVAYRDFAFRTERGDDPWGERRYLGFVLTPDGTVRTADLGSAEPIDERASQLLETIRVRARESAVHAPAQELYDELVGPFADTLKGQERWILSLDGQLQLVPFAALRAQGEWVVDRAVLAHVTSGRDLLRERASAQGGSRDVVIYANPRFGPEGRSSSKNTEGDDAGRVRAGHIPPLPGTQAEAESLADRVTVSAIRDGGDATEDAFLAEDAPAVLHVATHGLFLEDDRDVGGGTRGLVTPGGSEAATAVTDGPVGRDALLQSALLFSGAANALGSRGAELSGSDGVVTALEVAGMDLWGTRLVVLSACDTGRGRVRFGQGVYGLRRAFLVAGAETLVSSLWRVDDEVTGALMVAFYEALADGRTTAEAMRRAALEVRKEHGHPAMWAPFLVIGRDAAVPQLE